MPNQEQLQEITQRNKPLKHRSKLQYGLRWIEDNNAVNLISMAHNSSASEKHLMGFSHSSNLHQQIVRSRSRFDSFWLKQTSETLLLVHMTIPGPAKEQLKTIST